MTVSFQHRPLLTIAQTARRLAISEKSVRRLITAGVLPCSKIGGVLRISPEELENVAGGPDTNHAISYEIVPLVGANSVVHL